MYENSSVSPRKGDDDRRRMSMRESKRERDSNSQYEIRELRSLFWTTKIENILTLTERLNFMKFQQQQQ